MSITPNIVDIIKAEVDLRIKREVENAVERIVKELKEKEKEIVAKMAVDIALEPQIMEMGNVIRFVIHSKE